MKQIKKQGDDRREIKDVSTSVMVFLPRFRVKKWLNSLDNNGHIWSEIRFILHTKCCNCCKLSITKKHNTLLVKDHLLLLSKEKLHDWHYLSDGFWWIIFIQFWIHTLFNFVFTQPRSCLYHNLHIREGKLPTMSLLLMELLD